MQHARGDALAPSLTGTAPFALAAGMPEEYDAPATSACFALADDEAAVVYEHRGRECSTPRDPELCGAGGTPVCPAVVDKRFRISASRSR